MILDPSYMLYLFCILLDRWDCPLESHVYQPRNPTVMCRKGGTVHWNPMRTNLHYSLRSHCQFYPTIMCRIHRLSIEIPSGVLDPTVHPIPLYRVGPNRWDCLLESHVYLPIVLIRSPCPSYPTVPCRIGGTVHWNPMCTNLESYIDPTVRPIPLYRVG